MHRCSRLLADIETIQTGEHPGHSLLYEFHANQSGDPDQVLMHCLGHWRLTPAFHDLPFLPRYVSDERILTKHSFLLVQPDPARLPAAGARQGDWGSLLARSGLSFSSSCVSDIPCVYYKLFCKPARTGGGVAWHQDYSYWTRSTPMQHLTVHLALEDQDTENGCIQYVPGSHRWTRHGGPLPVVDFDFKANFPSHGKLSSNGVRH